MHNSILDNSSLRTFNTTLERLNENKISSNLVLGLDKEKTAWVFAGQGSQVLGMGKDLWEFPYVKSKMQQAERILGWSVPEFCNQKMKLDDTQYCQPCIFVVSSLLIDLLKQRGYRPDLVAGYSLGEYVALYAAGVFDFESGLHLIKRRAEIMAGAPPGIMVVLLGCDRQALEDAIRSTSDVELITDEHSRSIIAGSHSSVEWVLTQVEAKRVVQINVSKAFHTRFMSMSESLFQSVLNTFPFNSPQVPVLSNVDSLPTMEVSVIKENLHRHMTSTIYWQRTMTYLSKNASRVVEVSPREELIRSFKKSGFNCELHNISSLTDVLEMELKAINTVTTSTMSVRKNYEFHISGGKTI
jgi:[acyl-carrier-protein] S-malonyltransferase